MKFGSAREKGGRVYGPGWAITSATDWTAILINKMPGSEQKVTVMVWRHIWTFLVLFMLLWGRKVEKLFLELCCGDCGVSGDPYIWLLSR
jgi:hypothetical protein